MTSIKKESSGGAESIPKVYRNLRSNSWTVRGLLKGAVEQRKAGVNILIFGSPGRGKSEFTR
jgi:hypothetical protein